MCTEYNAPDAIEKESECKSYAESLPIRLGHFICVVEYKIIITPTKPFRVSIIEYIIIRANSGPTALLRCLTLHEVFVQNTLQHYLITSSNMVTSRHTKHSEHK